MILNFIHLKRQDKKSFITFESDVVPGKGEHVTLVLKDGKTTVQKQFLVLDVDTQYIILQGEDPIVIHKVNILVEGPEWNMKDLKSLMAQHTKS